MLNHTSRRAAVRSSVRPTRPSSVREETSWRPSAAFVDGLPSPVDRAPPLTRNLLATFGRLRRSPPVARSLARRRSCNKQNINSTGSYIHSSSTISANKGETEGVGGIKGLHDGWVENLRPRIVPKGESRSLCLGTAPPRVTPFGV